MKKKLLTMFMLSFFVFALFGCGKKDSEEQKNTNDVQSEDVNTDEVDNLGEDQPSKVEVAGWSIEFLDYEINDSLENVSIVLGYTSVGENKF